MFTIDQSENYKWEVNFSFIGENGKTETQSFNARFKRMKQSELAELIATCQSDVDIAKHVLIGWEDIYNSDGTPFEFSPENLIKLLDCAGMGSTIVLEIVACTQGAKRKN